MRVQSIGDYYTLHGAAEALGVSYWQVWRVVRRQQMPTLLLGQTLLVLLEDVERVMAGRETAAHGAQTACAKQAAQHLE